MKEKQKVKDERQKIKKWLFESQFGLDHLINQLKIWRRNTKHQGEDTFNIVIPAEHFKDWLRRYEKLKEEFLKGQIEELKRVRRNELRTK